MMKAVKFEGEEALARFAGSTRRWSRSPLVLRHSRHNQRCRPCRLQPFFTTASLPQCWHFLPNS
jgi:hypothetical protein